MFKIKNFLRMPETDIAPSVGDDEQDFSDVLDHVDFDEEVEVVEESEDEEKQPSTEEEKVDVKEDDPAIKEPAPESEVKVEEEVQPEPEREAEPDINVEEQKAKWLGELKGRYKISEEDSMKLLDSPEEVLPALAANVHAQVMMDVLNAFNALVPQLVEQVVASKPDVVAKAVTTHSEKETTREKFYQSYPELRGQEKVLATVAETVAKQFPNLSLQEQLEKTGQVAMTMLGLSRKVEEQVQEEAPKPFTPASGSNSGLPPREEKSEWDEFL
jgi:hypothetical protein